jgi:hypothetical protein
MQTSTTGRCLKNPRRPLLITIAVAILAALLPATSLAARKGSPKSPTFSLTAPKRSVVLGIGMSMSTRIAIKQSDGPTAPTSYRVLTKLKNVGVAKSEESPTGLTITLTAAPTAKKQKGFVDVLAKRGRQTKKLRLVVLIRRVESGTNGSDGPVTAAQAEPTQTPVAPNATVAVPSSPTALTPPSTTALPTSSTPTNGAPTPTTVPTTPTAPTTSAAVGDFAIVASQAFVPIAAGETQVLPVAVIAKDGYTGQPRFSVEDLPNGVTATFSPTTSKTGTSLTLVAGPLVNRGNTNVTVVGADGSLRRTSTFQLSTLKFGDPGLAVVQNFIQWVAPGVEVGFTSRLTPPPDADIPTNRQYEIQITTSQLPDPFAFGTVVKTFAISDGVQRSEYVNSRTVDQYVGLRLIDPTTKKELGRSSHLMRVLADPGFAFTSGSSATATTGLKNGTIEGNFALPFAPRNDIYGVAAPLFPPCTGDASQLLPFISGSGSSWTLNLSPRGLPVGSYSVSCPIKTGTVVNTLTATLLVKYEPLLVVVTPPTTAKP